MTRLTKTYSYKRSAHQHTVPQCHEAAMPFSPLSSRAVRACHTRGDGDERRDGGPRKRRRTT